VTLSSQTLSGDPIMSVVQFVVFKTYYAAVYVNQRFYELIDDVTDIEQILEVVKKVGNFEFQIYQNDDLEFLFEKFESVPLIFDDAIEYNNCSESREHTIYEQ
jgi:hypothetical protein